MLVQRRDPSIRAYFVWGLYQGTDSEERARESSRKFAAPNTVYYWMPRPEISRDLVQALKLGAGRVPFDIYLLYRRRALWEGRMPSPDYWQQQMGVLQGDAFDIGKLEKQIQRLLGR
jgi:hypothetical protein